MIKVLNNFLKEDEFKIIEDKIMSNEFPWYFQNETVTSVNYKEIPQFKLVNPLMTLEEFKVRNDWERVKRILVKRYKRYD